MTMEILRVNILMELAKCAWVGLLTLGAACTNCRPSNKKKQLNKLKKNHYGHYALLYTSVSFICSVYAVIVIICYNLICNYIILQIKVLHRD